MHICMAKKYIYGTVVYTVVYTPLYTHTHTHKHAHTITHTYLYKYIYGAAGACKARRPERSVHALEQRRRSTLAVGRP
jgi:hypothetical protein